MVEPVSRVYRQDWRKIAVVAAESVGGVVAFLAACRVWYLAAFVPPEAVGTAAGRGTGIESALALCLVAVLGGFLAGYLGARLAWLWVQVRAAASSQARE